MRKQSTQHSEVNHEDKLQIEDKSNANLFNNNAMSETLQTKKFGGGVTHRIRMMISDTSYNCRRGLRIIFFVNFFTLRVLFFIDLRKIFLHVLHI